MIKQIRKGNPKWVREVYGKYRWEYQKHGKYYSEGYYETSQEAHEACVKHQERMDMWRNPERHQGIFKTIPI